MPLGPTKVLADVELAPGNTTVEQIKQLIGTQASGAPSNEPNDTSGELKAENPRCTLQVPTSLTPRVLDGHWKKLLVFADSDFLPTGMYHFTGTELIFTALAGLQFNLHVITIIDPLDGTRWTYNGEQWERAG